MLLQVNKLEVQGWLQSYRKFLDCEYENMDQDNGGPTAAILSGSELRQASCPLKVEMVDT